MTFFYDMNKKLKEVLDTPKSEHKQLNERAETDESALQAYLGKKKYGEQGMKALQKAGREGASEKTMDKIRAKHEVDEGMLDSLKAGMKKAAKKGLETLGHGSDEAMRKDLQKKMGLPQTGKKPMGEEYGPMESEGGVPMTPKQKSFAKLAPPADKITFADKIAGAKKEVDEMLGDVAAEAMRGALKGGQKKLDKNHNGKLDAQDFAMLRAGKGKQETDEGSDWSQLGKEYSRPKIGSVERGAKHDIEHTATGRRVTRRTDDQGMSVGADDEAGTEPVKRGRGRPKGTGKAMGAKGPSGTSKLMKRESEQELDEKAVSKKQQKFMGMVHAAQKGEKAASPEVAKVAKTMKKKDAEDFASTKHKGLPEKVKSKKKEKTEESDAAPTSGKGVQFGKGIYDSLNREIENLIAESMSINASDSTEGGKSLTITATDEDAIKLAGIVRNAGLGGGGEMDSHEHGEVEVVGNQSPISGDEGACDTCGSHDCGCGDIEEALAENEPDWPTDEVESDDALQYSGGLNKPKTDVAGDGQTTIPNTAVHTQEEDELRRMMEMAGLQSELKPWERTMKEEAEEELDEQEQVMAVEESTEELDEAKEMCEVCEATPCKCNENIEESLARFRSLAGLKEAAKPDYIDLDKDGDREESMKQAADDKEAEDKKVEESIFRMTNLWKAYKG